MYLCSPFDQQKRSLKKCLKKISKRLGDVKISITFAVPFETKNQKKTNRPIKPFKRQNIDQRSLRN